MAPVNTGLENVQENVQNVIQDLFQVMGQVSNYDSAGRSSREALAHDLQTLDASLLSVYHTSNTSLPTSIGIPGPLLQYVEDGRNPDIYTREFVELVRRMNQLTRGKVHAFKNFRDVLAHEMDTALPELRGDVKVVLEATGGSGQAQLESQSQQGGSGGGGQ